MPHQPVDRAHTDRDRLDRLRDDGSVLDADALVEVAALVTDFELNQLGDGVDVVIRPPEAAPAQMGDFVREMHTGSGLLDALASGTTLEDAQAQVMAYVTQWCLSPRKAPLGGNTVGTDRAFSPATCLGSSSICTTGSSTCPRSRSSPAVGTREPSSPPPPSRGTPRSPTSASRSPSCATTGKRSSSSLPGTPARELRAFALEHVVDHGSAAEARVMSTPSSRYDCRRCLGSSLVGGYAAAPPGGCSSAGRAPGCGPGCRGFRAPSLTPPAQPSPRVGAAAVGGNDGGMLAFFAKPVVRITMGALALLARWSPSSRRPLRIRISDRSTQVTGRRSPLRRRHSPSPSPTTSRRLHQGRPAGTRWQPGRLAPPVVDSRHRPPGPPSARQRALPDHLPRRQRRLPTPSRARRPSPSTPRAAVAPPSETSRRPAARQRSPALGVTDRVRVRLDQHRRVQSDRKRPRVVIGQPLAHRGIVALIAAALAFLVTRRRGSILTGRGTDFPHALRWYCPSSRAISSIGRAADS